MIYLLVFSLMSFFKFQVTKLQQEKLHGTGIKSDTLTRIKVSVCHPTFDRGQQYTLEKRQHLQHTVLIILDIYMHAEFKLHLSPFSKLTF